MVRAGVFIALIGVVVDVWWNLVWMCIRCVLVRNLNSVTVSGSWFWCVDSICGSAVWIDVGLC